MKSSGELVVSDKSLRCCLTESETVRLELNRRNVLECSGIISARLGQRHILDGFQRLLYHNVLTLLFGNRRGWCFPLPKGQFQIIGRTGRRWGGGRQLLWVQLEPMHLGGACSNRQSSHWWQNLVCNKKGFHSEAAGSIGNTAWSRYFPNFWAQDCWECRGLAFVSAATIALREIVDVQAWWSGMLRWMPDSPVGRRG